MGAGTPAQISRYFSDFGLNSLFSFQAEKKAYADDCANCVSQYDDGIEKRQGYQAKLSGKGGYGMTEYTYTDWQGNLVEEILLVDNNGLYRILTGTLSITYSGTQPRAVVYIKVVGGQYQLKIYEGNTLVLTQNLGQGYEETSSLSLSTLATTISAVSHFSASVVGDSSVSAAFLDITNELSIAPGSTGAINYLYYQTVNAFTTMDGLKQYVRTDSIRNAALTPYNGYIAIADGGALKVYDGDSLYLAGLPQPTIINAELNSPGHLNNNYYYFMTYQYYDFQGNVSESAWSSGVPVTAVNQIVTLSLPTLPSNSGYNTRYGIINGTQTNINPVAGNVTLTVTSGHNLVTGSYAYFLNTDSSINDYAAYTISATTSTTITIQSDLPITVADQTLISANLRINVYRQAADSTIRYLISSFPNDPTKGIITYIDEARYATCAGGAFSVRDNGTVVKVSANTLVKGDVVTMPDGTTALDGTVLPNATTFFVVDSCADHIILSVDYGLIVPASSTFLLNDVTFANFIGNLDPSAGNVARRDPPPENIDTCASFNAQLVVSSGQSLYWSDTSEPLVSNSGLQFGVVRYRDRLSRPITALKQSGQTLIIGQADRIDKYTCTDLIFDVVVKTMMSDRIGIVGPSAVVMVGIRLFFLHQTGVYEINNGILSLNKPVYTYTSQGITANQTATVQDTLAATTGLGGALSSGVVDFFYGYFPFVWKRAVLGYDIFNNQLWVYLPIEEQGLYGWGEQSSVLLMYETRTDRWYKWTNVNIAGGMCYNAAYDLFFCERKRGASLRINTNRLTRRWDNSAYYDHTSPIYFLYTTKYDNLNAAVANNKKILKELKIYSVPRLPTDAVHTPTLTVTIYKDYVDMLHSTLSYTFPNQGKTYPFTWNAVPYQAWRPPYESLFPQTEGIESYALRIENNEAGMNTKITGWALQWQPRVANLRE